MFCKKCGVLMRHVMRFEEGKSLELEKCPRCHYESKSRPLKYSKTNTVKEGTKGDSHITQGRKDNVKKKEVCHKIQLPKERKKPINALQNSKKFSGKSDKRR